MARCLNDPNETMTEPGCGICSEVKLITDSFGEYMHHSKGTAKDAVEAHICALSQAEGCDIDELCDMTIVVFEVSKVKNFEFRVKREATVAVKETK